MKIFIKRLFYQIKYGLKFEKGYEYQMIKNSDLDLLETHHHLMISMGWEKYSDVDAGYYYAWCWYRKN